jgi:hypothetical protein
MIDRWIFGGWARMFVARKWSYFNPVSKVQRAIGRKRQLLAQSGHPLIGPNPLSAPEQTMAVVKSKRHSRPYDRPLIARIEDPARLDEQ